MYISDKGRELISEKLKIADKLRINMSIDVSDVPCANYGIVKNFNKDNYLDTITQLKLSIMDFLQYNKLTNVSLDNILYDNSEFTAYFSYLDTKLLIEL